MHQEEWDPGKLLEVSGYFWKTCTLHAGIKLNIFTIIGDQSFSDEEVSEKIGGNRRGISMLLNALSAMGLLKKKGDRYSNSKAAATFLSKDAPAYIGHMIMHHHHLVESWANLDEAVKSGKPVGGRSSFQDDERRESFLMGMFTLAMHLAPMVVPKIDLAGARSFLDLGGGPGTWGVYFCQYHPELNATVFDLPASRPFAEKTIQRFELSHRIQFVGGNYLEDDIPGRYDVAWLSHILHAEAPSDCERIIEKAVSVLNPGGQILIHEFILNNNMDGPLFRPCPNMLARTEAGQAYSETQLCGMLQRAGAKDIRRLDISTPNDSGIISGTI